MQKKPVITDAAANSRAMWLALAVIAGMMAIIAGVHFLWKGWGR